MADVAIPMETGGFGGMGAAGWMGALGGLILGSMWGGNGWGGFGGGRNLGQGVADVTIQTGLQNLQNAVNQGAVAQAQGVGAIGMEIANSGANTVAAVNAQTIAGLQGQNATQQQICCAAGRLSQEIDQTGDLLTATLNQNNITNLQGMANIAEKLGEINNNITRQGLENQLRSQQLSAENERQHCQDRELMRQIATEQMAAKLNEAQAKIVQLETQNYVNQSNSQQTLYLINQLKPTTTTAAAAAAA